MVKGSSSAIPIAIEENVHTTDPPTILQTPEDASFEEHSSRIQACQYGLMTTQNELSDFEAMLNECMGVDWQQQEEGLQVQRYVAAKKQMLKRHIEDFNTKYQAFHDT